MKVLMVNRDNAYSQFGGDTMQMLETKSALEKLGVEVDVKLGEQDTKVYYNYDVIHFFNIQTDSFTCKEVRKAKKAEKKIAVSTIWWDYTTIENSSKNQTLSKRATRLKSILGNDIFYKIQKMKRKVEEKVKFNNRKKILEYADILLPNSNIEVKMLNDNFFGCYSEKSAVIYNGICTEKLQKKVVFPSDIKNIGFENRKYAIQVGRIENIKNNYQTIRACIELDIPIVFIGAEIDEAYLKECKIIAKKAKVFFAGKREFSDIVNYYKHAKIHVLPSFRETPGLASLEAAYCGCNIVSTSVGSAKEYFGDLAHYCDPTNYESIKLAIKKAWESEGNNISEIISSNFTWDKAGEETLNAYNRIKVEEK